MSHLMNTYARLPVAFSHGDGSWLTDTDGKVYLDGLSGIAVNTLGHNHPRLVAAIAAQAGRLLHSSNLYRIPQQEQLADKLAALSGMDEIFFCNSGCEANEAAIKLARLYGHRQGVDSPATVVMEKAFHGRTMATLSATGSRKAQAGFEPLVAGFVRVPYNDLEAIKAIARYNKNIVAVMLEVVQGEGGINSADIDFQRGLRALCDDRGWLLICDEVQCGMGRTGRWFAFQHAGIRPDVVTLAKGLGGGVPIGACLVAGLARGLFKPGKHGSTFGGNQLATTAALTTIDVIETDQADRQCHRRRPSDPRRSGRGAGRQQGRGRHSWPGPDDRHRARSPLRRTGQPWPGGRSPDQRHRRQGRSPVAAADLRRRRSAPTGVAPGETDCRFSRLPLETPP
jgi:acetylornithine/N-succinyldiaminopimelate aminotransferase